MIHSMETINKTDIDTLHGILLGNIAHMQVSLVGKVMDFIAMQRTHFNVLYIHLYRFYILTKILNITVYSPIF